MAEDSTTDSPHSSMSFIDRLIGRPLSNIRVHKDQRAGDLAARLGARAFTVGRDIYIKPELADTTTAEGASLLAHELTHITEQSGGGSVAMPLLNNGRGAHNAGEAKAVQRAIDTQEVQAAAPAGLPASEISAERTERVIRGSAAAGGARPASAPGAGPDVEEIAQRVYRLLAEEITLDRERGSYLY
jgi:hypothetical protein